MIVDVPAALGFTRPAAAVSGEPRSSATVTVGGSPVGRLVATFPSRADGLSGPTGFAAPAAWSWARSSAAAPR